MALPTPPAYTTPIPNNPFYSNPSYLLQGAYSPYVVGIGLYVDPAGTISSTGGGGAVSSVIAGAGIGVSSPTGNVTLTNTGVTSLIAGSGITLSGNTGNITISATAASGTVTAVNTGTGLTGGPITTTGTIALANTGVAAATYTNPTIVVDAQGRITSASSGTAVGSVVGTAPISVSTALGTATVSISAATTAACGAVQLSDSTSSLSSATAATSLAVKTAFDVAVAAIPKSCITAKGTLVTGTGPSVPVALPVGSNGQVLTVDSACAQGIKWGAPGAGLSPNYGSFLGVATQTATSGVGVGIPVLLDTTLAATNFSVVGGSQVTAAVAGTYNLQFSIQIVSTGGGGGDVEIWLAKNGSAVSNSNTRFHLQNANEAEFAALNYVETLSAGDYLELIWATNNTNIQLHFDNSLFGGPDIPAVILTIVPVGA